MYLYWPYQVIIFCWCDLARAELNTPPGEAHQVLTSNAHRFYIFLSLHLQLNNICLTHFYLGESFYIGTANNNNLWGTFLKHIISLIKKQ